MKNILVGIDFDEKTDLLIEKASALAQKYGSKLWLLHAYAPVPEFIGFEGTPHYISEGRNYGTEYQEEKLNSYVKGLKDSGIQAEGIVLEGTTIHAILEESKRLNVDLIICGHHEHNFLYNLFFGSVSASVVRQSNIPVLVYPMG